MAEPAQLQCKRSLMTFELCQYLISHLAALMFKVYRQRSVTNHVLQAAPQTAVKLHCSNLRFQVDCRTIVLCLLSQRLLQVCALDECASRTPLTNTIPLILAADLRAGDQARSPADHRCHLGRCHLGDRWYNSAHPSVAAAPPCLLDNGHGHKDRHTDLLEIPKCNIQGNVLIAVFAMVPQACCLNVMVTLKLALQPCCALSRPNTRRRVCRRRVGAPQANATKQIPHS